MVIREVTYYGKTEDQLKKMKFEEFLELVPSRVRRSFKRGLTEPKKDLLKKLQSLKEGKRKKLVKTHLRDMIVVPAMLGQLIYVYSGKEFKPVEITVEKLGRYLGEFVMTRVRVQHTSPGIGATKSSAGAKKK